MPNLAEWVFLVIVIVVAPALALRSKQKLDAEPTAVIPYSALLFSILLTHGALLAFAVFLRGGLPQAPAIESRFDAPTWLACALFLGVAGVVSAYRWRASSEGRLRRLRVYLPKTRADHAWAIVLHAFVAIVEEIVYRAVLFAIVDRLCVHAGLPAWWPAAAICSAAFGLAHIVQGWESAIAVFILSIGFHIIVRVSDGLGAAIITHFVFDTVAIEIYSRLLRDMPDPPA